VASAGGRMSLLAVLGLDVKDFQRGMRQAERIAHQSAKQMQRVGRQMSTFISAPIALGAAGATKAASDFDKSMTKITTLVGINRDQVNGWRDDLLAMSGEVARGPGELAEGLFVVTSAGLRGTQAMEALTQAAKASVIGLGETDVIARTAAGAVNAFKEQNLGAAEAVDVLVATVRYGNLEVDSLAGSLGRVMSIAAEVGITFADVGAFVATFTRAGVNAEIATTSLRALLTTFIKPGEQATARLRKLGTNIDEVRDAIQEDGLALALFNLMERLDGNKDALGEVTPNIRALAGALATAKSQGVDFIKITKGIEMSLGLTDAAFLEAKQHAYVALDQIKADAESVAIKLGDVLLPAVVKVSGKIRELTDDFMNADREVVKSIVGWSALAAAIGPVLLGLAGLGFVISFVIVGFKGLWPLLYFGIGAVMALITATGAVIGFFGSWAGVITVVVVALGLLALSIFDVEGAWTGWVSKIPLIGRGLDSAITNVKIWLWDLEIEFHKVIRDISEDWWAFFREFEGIIPGAGLMADMGEAMSLRHSADFARLHRQRALAIDSLAEREKDAAADVAAFIKKLGEDIGSGVFDAIAPTEALEELKSHMEKFSDIFEDANFRLDTEGALSGKSGAAGLLPTDIVKMADRMRDLFSGVGDDIADALALTRTQKLNLDVEQGVRDLREEYDALVQSGEKGMVALALLAKELDLENTDFSTFAKFLEGQMKALDEATEAAAAQMKNRFGEQAMLDLFSGVGDAINDALALTKSEKATLALEQSLRDLREEYDALVRSGEKGMKALAIIQKELGLENTEFSTFAKFLTGQMKELEEATERAGKAIRINIGESISSTMDEMFTGFLRGTRDLESLTEIWSNSMIGIVEDMFSQFIKSKLGFDDMFIDNFMTDLLPAVKDFAYQAMKAIGGLFGWVPSASAQVENFFGTPAGNVGRPAGPAALDFSGFAHAGGITRGPSLAVVGDNPSGREAIIPLERWQEVMGGAGGGGGGETEIHIHAPSPLAEQRTGRDSSGRKFIEMIFEGAKGAVAEDIMRGGSVGRAITATYGSQATGGV